MLFMGQEFLEDKQWSDNFDFPRGACCCTGPVSTPGDRHMVDHLRFTRELIHLALALSRRFAGRVSTSCTPSDADRVYAFHRWPRGHQATTSSSRCIWLTFNRFGYRIGFPGGGEWREVFNSDVYEQVGESRCRRKSKQVFADSQPMHGYGHSAALTLPANSVLVFAR